MRLHQLVFGPGRSRAPRVGQCHRKTGLPAGLICGLDRQQVVALAVAHVVHQKVSQALVGIIKFAVILVPTAPGDDELRRFALVLVGKLFTWHGAQPPGA